MADRADAIARVREHLHSGAFLAELGRRVGYRTESQNPGSGEALRAYLVEDLQPAFAALDFSTRLIESPTGKGPYLLADYREDASLPTVLTYGHGDVVDGMAGEWRDNLDPWKTTTKGERVYGRGTADNKGQHSINLAALRAVRETRGGKLGFNAKFIIETGEEIGSPDLRQVCEAHREELKADLFLASDGPRLSADRPTIFLGCRGGNRIHLDVNLREGGHHSGNWGGVLANPATILCSAIASLVDGKGRMKLDALKPPRISNADPRGARGRRRSSRPRTSRRWRPTGARRDCRRQSGCLPGIRWKCWRCRRAISRSRPTPFRATPMPCCSCASSSAPRYEEVIDAVRAHLHANGFPMVEVSGAQRFAASRTDVDSPWVNWTADSILQDHRQGAGDPAEFRRLAAQRRVLRRAGPADDLGAAFLSRLLAACAGRTHSAAGDRRGARHHGGAVLGSRRDEEGAVSREKA